MTRLSAYLVAALCIAAPAHADDPAPSTPPSTSPGTGRVMPITGLAPARPMFDACLYRYGVGTTDPQCQAFVDQGLGMYYSYIWMEAARGFETALRHDPTCAYAWLMLSRSLEKWGRNPDLNASAFHAAVGGWYHVKPSTKAKKPAADYTLEQARRLMPTANPREELLIRARLQEKGMWPGTTPEQRTKAAAATLDELLTLYDDDQEGWFWRAQLAEGMYGKSPFYKALLRVNPLNPGANHELVHFYENIKRPALGWPFAEGYVKSSPGIPHAFHMQAHLATRIGKWGPTTDWSWRAVELEKQYHTYQGVTPRDDYQFTHHMDVLTRSLVHDGRFAEAKRIRGEAEGTYKYSFREEWFQMALAEGDWAGALKLVDAFRRANKADGAYHAALLFLEKGDTARAGAEIDSLRQIRQGKRSDRRGEQRLWEVQGRYLCQTGDGDAGMKMLKKLVDATKNDFLHHAWGNGAVHMEAWGAGALECGNAAVAEEAFQEALAHDAGSVRGALGLWALCDRLGRSEEADRYMKVARRCWVKAESRDFDRLKADFAAKAAKLPRDTTAAAMK